MKVHCKFDMEPPSHVSDEHGYLCESCWWYSDDALSKQHRTPMGWTDFIGIFGPRTPGVPCHCCGMDCRPQAYAGGDGVHCGLCLDRGHA